MPDWVTNLELKGSIRPLPDRSLMLEEAIISTSVSDGKEVSGRKLTIVLPLPNEICPAFCSPATIILRESGVTVVMSTGSLKVSAIFVLMFAPALLLAGVTLITRGGRMSALVAVVKLLIKSVPGPELPIMEFPALSVTLALKVIFTTDVGKNGA